MVVVLVLLLVAVTLGAALLPRRVARLREHRRAPDPALRPLTAWQPTDLPAGHQPPPGLTPLSPSERFLVAETARGLKDLERFLLDAA